MPGKKKHVWRKYESNCEYNNLSGQSGWSWTDDLDHTSWLWMKQTSWLWMDHSSWLILLCMKKLYVQIKHPVSTGRPKETLLGKRLAKSTVCLPSGGQEDRLLTQRLRGVQFTYQAVERGTFYLPSGGQ